ncbi:unnamed protein product, partial [Brassica rapa subsp. narinosa]
DSRVLLLVVRSSEPPALVSLRFSLCFSVVLAEVWLDKILRRRLLHSTGPLLSLGVSVRLEFLRSSLVLSRLEARGSSVVLSGCSLIVQCGA